MILRKPYAFFIKYFKVMHLIMAILIAMLIYKTIGIVSFFNSYIDDYKITLTNFDLGGIINIYTFLIALVVIIATIIVMSVMIFKKKPKLLYIYNLVLYIAGFIFFIVSYDVLRNITGAILDVRVSKGFRDVSVILLILEVISFLFVIVRATGFDIKKFDFGTDIQTLEINEQDSEEIEVAVEFDKNKARRNLRKTIRNIKYTYIENKFVINLSVVIAVILISFLIYFNHSIYNASYSENEYFSASGISMIVTDSYLVKNDYAKNTNLIVVRFDVKREYITEKKLNTGLITLRINNNSYSQTTKYNQRLDDLGVGYAGQKLTDEYAHYILTFAVDEKEDISKAKLKINDNVSYVKGEMGAKNIFINLRLKELDKNGKDLTNLTNIVDFKDSILKNTILTVDQVQLENRFKVTYDFCASKNNCYESYEYINPTATGNYAKSLLKITGTLKIDEKISISGVSNLLEFINMFGSLRYQINGTIKEEKINSEVVKAKMKNENNVYYVEIPRESLNANKISLVFKVRGNNYIYTIK